MALTEGGDCFTWGQGDYGQLGNHTNLSSHEIPAPVKSLEELIIVDAAVGNAHTVAVTDGGKVYAWGACWA